MKKMRTKFVLSAIAAGLTTLTTAGGVPLLLWGLKTTSAFLVILSLAFLIHGLYGLLFYWIWFARSARRYRISKAMDEGMTSAADISRTLKINRDTVNKEIRYCIRQGAFPGKFFDGNRIRETANA